MKKILKTALKVYAIFSMCIVTILLITAIVVWISFGKITAFAVEKVIDNYNTELNEIVTGYFRTAIPDNSIQFRSLQTISGEGLQASFRVNNNILSGVDINSFQNKTNEEIISELGITINDIPNEIRSLLAITKQALVLDFVDANGNAVINRRISSKEIEELLKGF